MRCRMCDRQISGPKYSESWLMRMCDACTETPIALWRKVSAENRAAVRETAAYDRMGAYLAPYRARR